MGVRGGRERVLPFSKARKGIPRNPSPASTPGGIGVRIYFWGGS